VSVSLDKIEQEAPHMAPIVRKAAKITLDKGIDPSVCKAAVMAALDFSGSAESLYESGEMQKVANNSFAAGLLFDDDGEVPVRLFHDNVLDLGASLSQMNLGNCENFIAKAVSQAGPMGRTNYVAALRWIIEESGYSNVDISLGGGRMFKSAKSASARVSAEYPAFGIFITDGEPNRGTEGDIVNLLTEMSQLPIFVQFVGVGRHDFSFLKRLDELEGRFIDNAGFFDAKDASNQDEMLEGLLAEFAETYYPNARAAGLITG
jgi:hypothetical protein